MDKAIFYQKLTVALLRSNFRFRAKDLFEEELDTDQDKLSSSIRTVAKFAPSIVGAITGVDLPDWITDIHPVFDQEGVRKRLDKVREYAALVCFKYVLAQPVIVAVVEADQLPDEEIIKLTRRFDEVALEMVEFTARMGGVKLGGIRLGGTRLAVTGIIPFTFFNHTMALSFIESTLARCSIRHFWKKTYITPWAIDVTAKEIKQHSILPVDIGRILGADKIILSADKLIEDVFGA